MSDLPNGADLPLNTAEMIERRISFAAPDHVIPLLTSMLANARINDKEAEQLTTFAVQHSGKDRREIESIVNAMVLRQPVVNGHGPANSHDAPAVNGHMFDAATIEQRMVAADAEALTILVQAVQSGAEFSVIEEDRLIGLAVKLTGHKKQLVGRALREARAKRGSYSGHDTPDSDTSQELYTVDQAVEKLNSECMVVADGNKTLIYVDRIDPNSGLSSYAKLDKPNFLLRYSDMHVKVGEKRGKPVTEDAGVVWLKSPKRRKYLGGVVFKPNGDTPDDVLNLWQGFAYEPKPGSWQLMQDHMLHVLCDGNREHFDYLYGWSSRMFQHPELQGETAVVLKGQQGSGKGIFAQALKKIIGRHAFYTNNSKHLVGNFNSHLQDLIFMFADEAFFAGDKAHVSTFKSLITDETLDIEEKFITATNTKNYLHIMMASNEDWVIPADLDDRRCFVLNVRNDRISNRAYFNAIIKEMENGGYEAMLYDLLNYDLTDFEVRDIPYTEGMQDQKKLSLTAENAWWRECLMRGYVFESKLGLADEFLEWPESISTELLYTSYKAFAKDKREYRAKDREAFCKWFKPMTIKAVHKRNIVVGEHITDKLDAEGKPRRQADVIIKDRATGYELGTLDQARDTFVDNTGIRTKWPEDDAEEEPIPFGD